MSKTAIDAWSASYPRAKVHCPATADVLAARAATGEQCNVCDKAVYVEAYEAGRASISDYDVLHKENTTFRDEVSRLRDALRRATLREQDKDAENTRLRKEVKELLGRAVLPVVEYAPITAQAALDKKDKEIRKLREDVEYYSKRAAVFEQADDHKNRDILELRAQNRTLRGEIVELAERKTIIALGPEQLEKLTKFNAALTKSQLKLDVYTAAIAASREALNEYTETLAPAPPDCRAYYAEPDDAAWQAWRICHLPIGHEGLHRARPR